MITLVTEDGSIKLELDGSIEETHELHADVTRNPIASGANVSDNIIIQPRTLIIEARMSPYTSSYLFGLIGKSVDKDTFLKKNWDLIKSMWLSKQLIIVTTDIDKYENMVFKSIPFVRNSATYGVLDVTFNLQEVFLVETGDDSKYSFEKGETSNQGTPAQDAGQKQAVEKTADEAKNIEKQKV